MPQQLKRSFHGDAENSWMSDLLKLEGFWIDQTTGDTYRVVRSAGQRATFDVRTYRKQRGVIVDTPALIKITLNGVIWGKNFFLEAMTDKTVLWCPHVKSAFRTYQWHRRDREISHEYKREDDTIHYSVIPPWQAGSSSQPSKVRKSYSGLKRRDGADTRHCWINPSWESGSSSQLCTSSQLSQVKPFECHTSGGEISPSPSAPKMRYIRMTKERFSLHIGDVLRVLWETKTQNSWVLKLCNSSSFPSEDSLYSSLYSVLKEHEAWSWEWYDVDEEGLE